jgi:hypothetical protein
VDGHGVVQVQEERQPFLRGERAHVRSLEFLHQVRVPDTPKKREISLVEGLAKTDMILRF